MRHLWSLIAGILIAPLAWLLIAVGQAGTSKELATAAGTGSYDTHQFIQPLIFLAVAGLLVGLIGALRLSPLGPLVAGLVYVTTYVGLLVDPKQTLDLLGYTFRVPGMSARGDLTTPLTSGLSLVVGALLMVAVAAPGRWRRWPVAPVEAEAVLEAEESPAPVWDNTAIDETPTPVLAVQPGPVALDEQSTVETSTEPLPRRERGPWTTPLHGTSQGTTGQ